MGKIKQPQQATHTVIFNSVRTSGVFILKTTLFINLTGSALSKESYYYRGLEYILSTIRNAVHAFPETPVQIAAHY